MEIFHGVFLSRWEGVFSPFQIIFYIFLFFSIWNNYTFFEKYFYINTTTTN